MTHRLTKPPTSDPRPHPSHVFNQKSGGCSHCGRAMPEQLIRPCPGTATAEEMRRVFGADGEELVPFLVPQAQPKDPRLSVADMVHLPSHYGRFEIEPIRFICENKLNFFQGNVIKYILRWDAKNGVEDLRKAQRYLEMFIKWVQGDPDWWRAPKEATDG